jgi:Transglycosylase SLT domain
MIHFQQERLDEEVRALYMSPPVEAIGSALGTTSLNDFQDAVEFLGAISQGNRDLIASLSNMRAELERHRVDLEALQGKLTTTSKRLRKASGDVVRKLADARALLRRLDRDGAAARALIRDLEKGVRTEARRRIDELDSPDPPFPPGPQEVKNMIRRSFGPLGPQTQQVAICVADVESDFDPLAVNPSTGAAGVYQFKPSTWSSMSVQAGWGGHSVFDAQANVAVAAWTVGRYGWAAWGSVATSCGAP